MVAILTDTITKNIGEIREGDILVVKNENGNITKVYGKDEEEKERRIKILKSIMKK